jgi:hypothetical protein
MAEMNFIENLPFSYLERAFPTKALPYLFGIVKLILITRY